MEPEARLRKLAFSLLGAAWPEWLSLALVVWQSLPIRLSDSAPVLIQSFKMFLQSGIYNLPLLGELCHTIRFSGNSDLKERNDHTAR